MSSEMATHIEMMYDYEMMGLYDDCIAIGTCTTLHLSRGGRVDSWNEEHPAYALRYSNELTLMLEGDCGGLFTRRYQSL